MESNNRTALHRTWGYYWITKESIVGETVVGTVLNVIG